jgi:hypothetical protein
VGGSGWILVDLGWILGGSWWILVDLGWILVDLGGSWVDDEVVFSQQLGLLSTRKLLVSIFFSRCRK